VTRHDPSVRTPFSSFVQKRRSESIKKQAEAHL
jgi:hypothetical protein